MKRRDPLYPDADEAVRLPFISGLPRRQPPALPADPLIGREVDLDRIRKHLHDPSVRITTLLGPGGVGKTRLALTVAHEVSSRFRDGVLFVQLDRFATVSLAEAIGRYLSVSPGTEGSWHDAVIAALRARKLLLVLDNCESMTEGMAELPSLLETCPGIDVLATSRQTLRLPGEHEVWVPPLAVPGAEQDGDADVRESPAVQLFLQRARKVVPDLEITTSNASAMREIARRLDGLPLALELAAAYLRHLSLDDMLEMLDEALPALGGGSRALPERQQSLRNLVRWSLDALPQDVRTNALRLAIFPSGFSPQSVAALMGHGTKQAAWDLLTQLSDACLVTRAASTGQSDARFHMLQTIRSVLLAELQSTPGLMDDTLHRLSRALVAAAKEADRHYHGPEGIEWLRQMRDTAADARLMVLESLARPALRPAALELCGDMFWYWYSQGHYRWALPRVEELLTLAADTVPALVRARAHVSAGWFAHRMAQVERAEVHFSAARELFGDERSRGSLLCAVGWSYVLSFHRPDTPAAIQELERVIELAPGVENAWHELAAGHFGIGLLRYYEGDLEEARERFRETLRLGKAHDDAQSMGMALVHLAHVDRAEGELAAAFWKLREALPLLMELGDLATIAMVLDIVAAMLVTLDACELAMQVLAIGEHLRGIMSLPRGPLEIPDVEATRARIDAWRSASGRDLADGSTFDLGKTIDQLLRFDPERAEDGANDDDASEERQASTILSPRELEVLQLVATGMTSPEIAASLFVSPHTVKRHMANIRSKLGVRSQAAAVAALRDSGA